jgi:hypothetical protein
VDFVLNDKDSTVNTLVNSFGAGALAGSGTWLEEAVFTLSHVLWTLKRFGVARGRDMP